jgi:hypothetical protein
MKLLILALLIGAGAAITSFRLRAPKADCTAEQAKVETKKLDDAVKKFLADANQNNKFVDYPDAANYFNQGYFGQGDHKRAFSGGCANEEWKTRCTLPKTTTTTTPTTAKPDCTAVKAKLDAAVKATLDAANQANKNFKKYSDAANYFNNGYKSKDIKDSAAIEWRKKCITATTTAEPAAKKPAAAMKPAAVKKPAHWLSSSVHCPGNRDPESGIYIRAPKFWLDCSSDPKECYTRSELKDSCKQWCVHQNGHSKNPQPCHNLCGDCKPEKKGKSVWGID